MAFYSPLQKVMINQIISIFQNRIEINNTVYFLFIKKTSVRKNANKILVEFRLFSTLFLEYLQKSDKMIKVK